MTSALRVNELVAHDVAAAYIDTPNQPNSSTVAAFMQLVSETDELFRSLGDVLQISFTTCATPYRDADELIMSVRDFRVLEVPTVAADRERRHPLMENGRGGSYDRFRAVHDALGHARLQLGFDRDGEYAVWRSQERFHSPLARHALATELHGQHSVRWTTGEAAAPKAILFDVSLVQRARGRGDH